MRKVMGGCLLAGTLVLSGCSMNKGMGMGGAGMEGTDAAAMQKDMPKDAMMFQGMPVPTKEKDFMERLHMANMMEIKAGQMAQMNAHSPDVKAFARRMVDMHTKADQQLMQHAKMKGMELGMKPKPMNEQEKKMMAAEMAEMEKLAALKGPAFDHAYLTTQVGMHDSTHMKLMAGQKTFTSGPMAPMLQAMASEVAMHRQEAYQLLGKMAPATGTGGSGMQPMIEEGSMDGMMDGQGGSDMEGTTTDDAAGMEPMQHGGQQ